MAAVSNLPSPPIVVHGIEQDLESSHNFLIESSEEKHTPPNDHINIEDVDYVISQPDLLSDPTQHNPISSSSNSSRPSASISQTHITPMRPISMTTFWEPSPLPYSGHYGPSPDGVWLYYNNSRGGIWDRYVPNPKFYTSHDEGYFIPPEMDFNEQMGLVPVPMPIAQFAPPTPVFFQDTLHDKIVNQINYYFSDDNLAKDAYFRSKMDYYGWVPINLIASFPRVQQLTKDIPFILESLKSSTIVQVQGYKVRRRNAWRKWLPPKVVF